MDFKEITNKDDWDKKIGASDMAQFLQSWSWGEFQKSLGRKIWRLDFGGSYILAIKMLLPLGKSYLYIPRIKSELGGAALSNLRLLAKQERCIFIKIETVKQDLGSLGFKKTNSVQPGKTLILDLSKSENELLAEMHPKTRYNINLAAKKGVSISEGGSKDLDTFYNLISNTFSRKGLNIYNKNYYQKILETFVGSKIYLAQWQGKVLCANLILRYGDTVTYLHGGSSSEDKNIMAPHLLQWEIIKMAKAEGYKYYDFWGIDEKKWPGVTRFKTGFGGFEIQYAGGFDLPINKLWYLGYKILKKLK
ncbi:MAG: peptidoglycan bridge formation glycyltransferase FemA/FemB family protein [Patescibacteria group bacterium]|nr:peptidoglycan bridge formation glycyltransferase FemA/FemB family protein [Patescibacteria group bacterium]